MPRRFPPISLANIRQRVRWPRTLRAWAAIIGSLLLAALFVCWILSRGTPSWYGPFASTDNRYINNIGSGQTKILADLNNALQRTPLGDQRWTITQDELNALLTCYLPTPDPADASVPPPLVSAPFVRLTPGLVTFAARTSRVSSSQRNGGVISASFVVESIPGTGGMPMGHIRLASAAVGNLPIPTSIVQAKIRGLAPTLSTLINDTINRQLSSNPQRSNARDPEIETAIHAIADSEPFPLLFTYHDRKILVKEIKVDSGLLTILFAPSTPAAVPPRPPRH